ncbi:MAG TPA: BatA domain-containing protein [Arenimonas sp.]|uniref:BatA domain-containing protein n=1 Tax=Arenimonas sp. TaxID=1872635 RepID=UPI002D7E7B72|nr:BatA domain-containing protein [Arenimonas sp.]HEU0152242.1 BatA domain-containing protein [Arenimonas sp.]
MSLGLLAPAALWALAALALPLLLHLARREEQKPTLFAALRWLSARVKPRQKLRLEERLLLAVRLLLVAALVLLLAQPVLHGGGGDRPWLMVMPGADPTQAPALAPDAERRWLAPGFPPLDSAPPAPPIASASLLRQLDAELPAGTPVTVLATARFDGADGEPPRLSRRIDWRVVDGEPAEAKRAPTPPFTLAVRHDGPDTPGLRFLRAAAIAWQPGADAAPDVADADSALAAESRHLAWLAPGPLPPAIRAWIDAGGRALIASDTDWPLPGAGEPAWPDARGEPRARAATLGQGRVLQLAQPLSPSKLPALLEPDFPEQLRDLLQAPAPAPGRALASTYSPQPGGAGFPETPRALTTPLLWLLLALFALERWLATGRREATA